MAGGLVALIDDVAMLVKLASASLDDVASAAARAGSKSAGVVIDDTAVTPRYVSGLASARELPIIARIALGSLRNKLLIILPMTLALSAFAPWAITPLLMLGGSYLCYEAVEKIWEAFSGHGHADEVAAIADPAELEARQVNGAIQTDFILSAEIMAIALAELSRVGLGIQAAALVAVAIGITAGVYGVVAVIVKIDDVGMYLVCQTNRIWKVVGRWLVRGMPILLALLSHVGVAAMLWVGGGIILHGLNVFGLGIIPETLHHLAAETSAWAPIGRSGFEWLLNAAFSGVIGLGVGALIVGAVPLLLRSN